MELRANQTVNFWASEDEPRASGTITRVWVKPKADPFVTIKSRGRTFVRLSSVVRPQCSTIGCKRDATEQISYQYRGEPERSTELDCTPCAESYARRPVLVGLVRVPLDKSVPVLQRYMRGWTSSVSNVSTWHTMRPATQAEIDLAATTEHGQFWLRSDGTSYYHPFAKNNADQAARVAVLS
jgi:hypothetical protein